MRLRAVIGITFFIHGLSKFQGGISNTVGFFESLGIPGFLAYVVAVVELLGGIALILGLGTRIVTLLFALILVGVTAKERIKEIVQAAKLADEAGLDVFGVGEHHRLDYASSSPAVLLAAIAQVTKQIRLTSTSSVLSTLDPVRLFEDFATLWMDGPK